MLLLLLINYFPLGFIFSLLHGYRKNRHVSSYSIIVLIMLIATGVLFVAVVVVVATNQFFSLGYFKLVAENQEMQVCSLLVSYNS